MENIVVTSQVLPDGKSVPIGHQFEQCHMVFDIKMENFRQKARLVAGGNMTKASATIMYASTVSREKVRIDLMIAALNNLEVKLSNNLNAYVQVPVREKVWTTLSPEIGKDARMTAVIVRTLSCLKSVGAAFMSHLPRCMESFGYESCKVDPD